MLQEVRYGADRYRGGVDDDNGDLTIDIPDELYERLRVRAAWHSKTPEEFVRDLIEEIASRPD